MPWVAALFLFVIFAAPVSPPRNPPSQPRSKASSWLHKFELKRSCHQAFLLCFFLEVDKRRRFPMLCQCRFILVTKGTPEVIISIPSHSRVISNRFWDFRFLPFHHNYLIGPGLAVDLLIHLVFQGSWLSGLDVVADLVEEFDQLQSGCQSSSETMGRKCV